MEKIFFIWLTIQTLSSGFEKCIWTTLNTFLFLNIMLAEAVLSASVFIPPRRHNKLAPSSLALQFLETLSHLSYVISQSRGVATNTKGIEHLMKTFYLALDILAQWRWWRWRRVESWNICSTSLFHSKFSTDGNWLAAILEKPKKSIDRQLCFFSSCNITSTSQTSICICKHQAVSSRSQW